MGGETEKEREKRLKELWNTLDSDGDGQIDVNGLRKGFRKMDHPLKNADAMLHKVLEAVDTSGDGRIQYSEFKVFVDHAERELRQLFTSIDHNQNGELDKAELKLAFRGAGLAISSAKLDHFFAEVDVNNDGVISFEEWRNFLLFIPAGTPNLGEVLSYYCSTATLNSEGDVNINDSLQGFGNYDLLRNSPFYHTFINTYICTSNVLLAMAFVAALLSSPTLQAGLGVEEEEEKVEEEEEEEEEGGEEDGGRGFQRLGKSILSQTILKHIISDDVVSSCLLIQFSLISNGYFVAGGMAGMVSRTATAPLDRLKVYLIAQTSNKAAAIEAAKQGLPAQTARHIGQSLIDACKEVWRAGGIRSLYAGNGLNAVKVMPESAIKFGAYEAAKRSLAQLEGHNDSKNLRPISQFVAGGMGGVVSQCVVYPLDTLKFRMQCETVSGGLRGNALILSTGRQMLHSPNGVLSYYRGLGMGLAGMFPYSAIDLFIFEHFKSVLLARKARRHHCHESDVPLGNVATGAIGAVSGAFSATVVYPVNLLRTRLQAQGTVLHPPTYSGIVDVTRKTVRGEGFAGLFKGVTPNLLKVAPAVSISYVVYENCKALMGLY